MKVAVTGATGALGPHVLAQLAKASVDTVAVVRPASTRAAATNGCRVVKMDVHAPPPDAFDRMGRPDCLIHLAWAGLPNYRSLHHFDHELPAQYTFLRCLVEAGLPSLLVTGTCFEYGMQSGPLREDATLRPENPYGYAKNALRQQLSFLKATRPFGCTWARLFYLHGHGQAESSLFPQLKGAVARGDAAFNMSGGEQLRDYLRMEEAASYLVALALSKKDVGCVNVCSGRPVSVRTLVETWLAENDWSITLNLGHYPYPDYEPMAFWGERSKLDRFLDGK